METNLQEVIPEQTKTLSDFRQCLLDDGKANRTVQSYVTDVLHFMSHVTEANPKRLSELTRQDVTQFRNHMVLLGSEKAFEVRLRGSSFPPLGDWYCARISLVKGNAGGLKPLEGT